MAKWDCAIRRKGDDMIKDDFTSVEWATLHIALEAIGTAWGELDDRCTCEAMSDLVGLNDDQLAYIDILFTMALQGKAALDTARKRKDDTDK